MTAKDRRHAYENPADLAWGAQQVQIWLKRRRLRLAADRATTRDLREQTAADASGGDTDAA